MTNTEINLIKRDVVSMQSFTGIEEKLRIIAWWFLVGLFGVGLIIGSLFLYLNAGIHQLENEETQLSRQIDAQSVKEVMLITLKERVGIAEKALAAARRWGNLFPILANLAQPVQLNSLSVEETGRVSLILKLASVDEAVTVVTNTINLSDQKIVRTPQLLSFFVKQDGSVQMGLSFVPVL